MKVPILLIGLAVLAASQSFDFLTCLFNLNPPIVWPNGTVLYCFANEIDNTSIACIQKAMDNITALVPCVQFELTDCENAMGVLKISYKTEPECGSTVGYPGNDNGIFNYGTKCHCRTFVIAHELGHGLGLIHAHQACNRDSFVRINWSKIQPDKRISFERKAQTVQIPSSHPCYYDYGSVMHYGRHAYAINPNDTTIEPLTPNTTIGQRTRLSDCDVYRLKLMYGCV